MTQSCKAWCLCNRNAGLLIIRVIIGVVFTYHGYTKITGMFGTIEFFKMLGLSPFFAYFVAYAEFIGGILMILGAFTGIVGIVFATMMFFAIMLVKKFEYSQSEFELVLLVVSVGLVFTGAGKYAVQHFFKKGCKCDTCHVKGAVMKEPAKMM